MRKLQPNNLAWLTLATIGLGLWLNKIGPPGIAHLEFAYNAASLNLVELDRLRPKLYLQLGVDFLFIISYTVMLTSYCVAAAKVFWQRLETLEQTRSSAGTPTKSLARRVSLLNWLATIGFIMAGLQCLAGAADVAENAGLLYFLRDHRLESGLRLAYYCAFLKFILVALGGLYSGFGFTVGIFGASRRWWLYPLALIGLLIFVWASYILWGVPLGHANGPWPSFLTKP